MENNRTREMGESPSPLENSHPEVEPRITVGGKREGEGGGV